MIRLLLYTAPSPAGDLALEESIQLALEDGSSPTTWRIWQPYQPAVVLGTGQEAAREVELDAAKTGQIEVLRRHSGGGAVVIGPGIINFSVFHQFKDLPGSDSIRGAMMASLKPIVQLLAGWKIQACDAGLSDLAVVSEDGTLRKIAGNAQARKKISVLVHGTLLANPDWARLSGLLKHPSKVPEYRVGRDHRAFLTCLKDLRAPYDMDSFVNGLLAVLGPNIAVKREPEAAEAARAQQLVENKYGDPAWNYRR